MFPSFILGIAQSAGRLVQRADFMRQWPRLCIFISFLRLLIRDGACTSLFLMCAMQFLHFYFRFPRRTTPVSTGCSAWRDSTRVMLFLFIFLAPVFGAQMCAVDSDIVYLILSARIAGTCAVNILLIDLSVAVLIVRRGRMHTFLSFFNSSLVERQHRLRGNIVYGRDV